MNKKNQSVKDLSCDGKCGDCVHNNSCPVSQVSFVQDKAKETEPLCQIFVTMPEEEQATKPIIYSLLGTRISIAELKKCKKIVGQKGYKGKKAFMKYLESLSGTLVADAMCNDMYIVGISVMTVYQGDSVRGREMTLADLTGATIYMLDALGIGPCDLTFISGFY